MKIYESISRKDLEERFKPVQVTLPAWPFGQTLIESILRRQTTPTGKVIYLVRFKDGQTRKISGNELNESHKQLVEDFELEVFRSKEQPLKRKTVPVKRKSSRTFSHKTKLRKRVRFEANSDSNDSLSNFIVDSSEDEEAQQQTQPFAVTRSGRQSNKKMTFENEFYPNGVKVKTKSSVYTYNVPLYEDSDFIKNHSEYCFRCDGTGYYNGSVEVPIGVSAKRMRLLLCKTCSYSIHNNCLPNGRASHHFHDGEYKCVKCSSKKNLCQYDQSALTKKSEKEIPFRCNACARGFHQKCIVKSVSSEIVNQLKDLEMDDLYAKGLCIECLTFGMRTGNAIGERLVDGRKELLIKWKNASHRHTNWVSENWFQHAQPTTYKTYLKRKLDPTFEVLTSVPAEWKTVDRILNVEWIDKSKLKAKRILAVYKDTSYDDAVWDDPPKEDDTEFYPDYKLALERYIQATTVTPPQNMSQLIANVRKMAMKEGYEKHEYKSQPDFINGGTLMKHQLEALNWLLYQWEHKQSCVLADDMGLGKTIQIISYLYVLFKKYRIYPFVVVVPNSTATNWVREFQKWAPDMTVAPYFGGQVSRKLAMDNEIMDKNRRLKCHVVVTTYESSMEISELHRMFWAVMVVDESQRLKNDQSVLFRTLKQYKVDQITLLTGTPLQNNLKELFNIMNFIQPKDFHGSEAERYIEMTQSNIEELHKRLRPHFLRRTKEEVLKTLPPKYELIVPLSMTPIQKEVYKDCLNKDIYETLSRSTGAKVQRGLSSIFMNLRKVLNHPYLLDGVERAQKTPADTQTAMINACEKLKVFHQMFPKLKAKGHRLLIFSTMTRTLDILEDYFNYEKIRYTRIDGSCNERARVRSIDAFNAPNSQLDVFLLTTRAGGVGINLATSDTVVIWDSDFNPYADLQAISRAHRIGQNNMVLILRFMTRLSIEEKILQIGKKKMALEHVVVERMKEKEEESYDDIESILKFGAEALFSDDSSKDIHYDSASLDSLLDREQYRDAAMKAQKEEIEAAEKGNEKASEQGLNFSFAKVWKRDGSLEDLDSDDGGADKNNEEDFWQKFLKQKEIEEAEKREKDRLAAESLGRGARKRVAVTYTENLRVLDKNDMDAYIPPAEDEHHSEDEKVPKTPLFRINGPRRPASANSNNNLEIQNHTHHDLPQSSSTQSSSAQLSNTQSIQLQTQQQQQIHQQHQQQIHQQQQQPGFSIPDFQQSMFNEMLQHVQEPLSHLKALSTQSFKDKMQHSQKFHDFTRNFYSTLMMNIENHYRAYFVGQFNIGKAQNIDINFLNKLHDQQITTLKNNMHRLELYINEVMQNHYKELTAPETLMHSTSENASQDHNPQQQVQHVQLQTHLAQPMENNHMRQVQTLHQQHTQQSMATSSSQPVQQKISSPSQQVQQNTMPSTSQQLQQKAMPVPPQQNLVAPLPQQVQKSPTASSQQHQQSMMLPVSQQVQQSVAPTLQQQQQHQIEAQMHYHREQPVQLERVYEAAVHRAQLSGQQLTPNDVIQQAAQLFQQQTLKDAKEKAEREAKERHAHQKKLEQLANYQAVLQQQAREQEQLQRLEREKALRISQERIEKEKIERIQRERAERIAREARELAERERIKRVKEQAEREAREQAERESRERAEREAREQAERDAEERTHQIEQTKLDEQSKRESQMQEHLRNEQALRLQQSSSSETSSQSVPQLPEVMTRSMIMSMASYFSEHEGQNISSQDFLTHIHQIAQKEAAEKRLQSEEQRRLEFLASQSELRDKAAKQMEMQRKREAQTMNELRIHMMSSNLNAQLQGQHQQQQIDTHFTTVDPDVLARSNAALFKTVSPETRRSMFSTPPPQPDTSFLERYEKSTMPSTSTSPSSPAKLSYPSGDETQSTDNNKTS